MDTVRMLELGGEDRVAALSQAHVKSQAELIVVRGQYEEAQEDIQDITVHNPNNPNNSNNL